MTDYTFLSLRPVFPDTKPYGVLDLEVPGKLPATAWEKGKGSEVSVMLTVSAAAAKVCPRGTVRPRRAWVSGGLRTEFGEGSEVPRQAPHPQIKKGSQPTDCQVTDATRADPPVTFGGALHRVLWSQKAGNS